MNPDDRQLLEDIRQQNLEILSLLRGEGDGGYTVAMLAAAPDPLAAIQARNRRIAANKRKR